MTQPKNKREKCNATYDDASVFVHRNCHARRVRDIINRSNRQML